MSFQEGDIKTQMCIQKGEGHVTAGRDGVMCVQGKVGWSHQGPGEGTARNARSRRGSQARPAAAGEGAFVTGAPGMRTAAEVRRSVKGRASRRVSRGF